MFWDVLFNVSEDSCFFFDGCFFFRFAVNMKFSEFWNCFKLLRIIIFCYCRRLRNSVFFLLMFRVFCDFFIWSGFRVSSRCFSVDDAVWCWLIRMLKLLTMTVNIWMCNGCKVVMFFLRGCSMVRVVTDLNLRGLLLGGGK